MIWPFELTCNFRLVDVNAFTAPAGAKGPGSISKAPSADYSLKNRSSIAFLAKFKRSSGPGAGKFIGCRPSDHSILLESFADTKLLMLGDAMLTSDILAGNYYTIIKVT